MQSIIAKLFGYKSGDTNEDWVPVPVDASGNLKVNVAAGTTGATEFNEDDAHSSGDAGVQMLGVRKDEPGALAGASLDYAPFQTDSLGNVRMTAYVSGDVAADAADAGNPVKTGGVARQTNPTAVADADRVSASFDDLGRQVMTLHQVRDLRKTALASPTTGAETTLLAATAGSFHDLLYVFGANTSNAAVTAILRDASGGNAVAYLEIPAESTAGFCPSSPVPQSFTGNDWTVETDGSDVSNTTVHYTALFTTEV